MLIFGHGKRRSVSLRNERASENIQVKSGPTLNNPEENLSG